MYIRYFSSLYVFVHVLLRNKSEAHDKIIISIHIGLVVHITVYTETRPGIGSDQYSAVVVKVHRSSTWVKVQIRIIKYYSSKSKSTAFSILLEWKYKSTQFFIYLSKKVLIDRFILQFYIDYFS